MEKSFNRFLDEYLEVLRNSSLPELKLLISREYRAREVTEGKISDFGYDDSIRGWEQGFDFVKGNEARWELTVIDRIKIREHEVMAIILASLVINGKQMETGNLFFQTFTNDFGWKLIRSYIEAGIPVNQF
ncbi:hypothetical protein G3A_04345 [Bacillus sp. 17376]|uniref:Flavoprotein n=1 Tax=Mesobacillus boroniphilus JCM 21738 TaxID=1294265 RepID=W4RWB6_9BACI|nr:hypothetical protein [Mesobacillus boroniphilus]ESU33807.1 hypothetical protein G3A_04345 [Bacillus sp. 17376]GAE48402.1 hypothetical protein JCM21738_5520 [Mesobacillus boroniphilus JCM 21738]